MVFIFILGIGIHTNYKLSFNMKPDSCIDTDYSTSIDTEYKVV